VSSKAAVNAANNLLKDGKVSPANIAGLEFTQVVGALVLSVAHSPPLQTAVRNTACRPGDIRVAPSTTPRLCAAYGPG
jgi:hypothetical protein